MGKQLSYVGRLVLLKLVLQTIPIYRFMVYEIPKFVIKALEVIIVLSYGMGWSMEGRTWQRGILFEKKKKEKEWLRIGKF